MSRTAKTAPAARYSLNAAFVTIYVSGRGLIDAASVPLSELAALPVHSMTMTFDVVARLFPNIKMSRSLPLYRDAAEALLIARDEAIERGLIA